MKTTLLRKLRKKYKIEIRNKESRIVYVNGFLWCIDYRGPWQSIYQSKIDVRSYILDKATNYRKIKNII